MFDRLLWLHFVQLSLNINNWCEWCDNEDFKCVNSIIFTQIGFYFLIEISICFTIMRKRNTPQPCGGQSRNNHNRFIDKKTDPLMNSYFSIDFCIKIFPIIAFPLRYSSSVCLQNFSSIKCLQSNEKKNEKIFRKCLTEIKLMKLLAAK